MVNTCEEYAGPVVEYAEHGIEQLRIPTTDFTHPRMEDVERAVEFVQDHAQRGETVYIHCKAGRAQSANGRVVLVDEIPRHDRSKPRRRCCNAVPTSIRS